jgi:hypothetical protein
MRFKDEIAIVIERYDRVQVGKTSGSACIRRIHARL